MAARLRLAARPECAPTPVAPLPLLQINLLACKFMSADGWGKTSDAIQCLDACVRADAAIISASWTSGQFDNPPLDEAVGRVQRAGVLMVVSAGNQGVDMRRAKFYPQSYATKYSNMLVVSESEQRSSCCHSCMPPLWRAV